MEDKLGEDGRAPVAHSSMPQDELSDSLELLNREVGGKSSLHSLFANDANSHVSLKDHANIVSSVSDSCDPLPTDVVLQCPHNISLLSRAAAADAETRSNDGSCEELMSQLLRLKDPIQRPSVENQEGLGGLTPEINESTGYLITALEFIGDEEELIPPGLEASGNGDRNTSLYSVTSEHPNLDTCIP